MKKIILALSASVLMLGSMTSCKKEGCTDGDATNFDSEASKDNGTCTFSSRLVFWWKKDFRDSCAENGISNINVYFDNKLAGSLPVSSLYWNSAPSCGATGALTINKDLGSNKSGTYAEYEKLLDGSGSEIITLPAENIKINANTCNQYEMTW
jgi:hypothetical protein